MKTPAALLPDLPVLTARLASALRSSGWSNGPLEIVAMLELTPTEQANVQRAVDQARERLAEYERANSTVERKENGTVMIATKPFPEPGGAVFDELMTTIATAIAGVSGMKPRSTKLSFRIIQGSGRVSWARTLTLRPARHG